MTTLLKAAITFATAGAALVVIGGVRLLFQPTLPEFLVGPVGRPAGAVRELWVGLGCIAAALVPFVIDVLRTIAPEPAGSREASRPEPGPEDVGPSR